MSEQITCTECGAGNAPGSKFCNNCGTRLPLSTHTICPNCETPNPRNRIYCDNCGARLVEEHILPEEKPEEEETYKPSSANLSFFSLPTRKPGDTGELAPGLPEGMEAEKLEALDSAVQDDLPKVEELTGQGPTADLPDWLVESNAEPIIKPPEAITTEHYFDLLKRSIEEETGEEATDEDIAATAASLPEWLAAAGVTPPTPAEEIDEPQTSDTVEIPDWISLPGDDKPDESEPDEADEDDLQDWLAELGPPATDILASPLGGQGDDADQEEDHLADWLAELGPPNTNILSQPSDADAAANLPAADLPEDRSDWLTDLAPPDTGPLAESDAATPTADVDDVDEAEEADNWLASLTTPDTGPLAEADVTDDSEATIISQTPFDEDEGGWLTELDTPDTDSLLDLRSDLEETLISRPEDLPGSDWLDDAAPAEPGAEEPESDWLATPLFADEAAPEEMADEAETEDTAVDLAQWFTDDELADVDAGEPEAAFDSTSDSLLARLSDFVAEDADIEPVESPTAADEDGVDWLADEEPEQPVDTDTAVPAELPDWLSDLGPGQETDDFAALNQLAGGDDALPDWFDEASGETDSDSGYSPEADLFLTGLLQSDKVDDASLDWLTAEEKSTAPELAESEEAEAAQPELVSAEAEEPLSEEDPAWLTSLFTTALDETPEISEPAAATEPESEEAEFEEAELDALFVEAGIEAEMEDTAVTVEMSPDTPSEPDELAHAPVLAEADDDDTWFSQTLTETDQPLPDWIEQLGAAATDEISSETELVPSDELPDWVADMRPELSSEAGSLLPRASTEDDALLADIPDELVGVELPEWLQDVGVGGDEVEIPAEAGDVTGWIESESRLAELLALDEEDAGSGSDWGAVLGELPPSAPVEERLAEAELPEWIEALKPRELTTEGPESEAEPEPEESGPLVGVRGVVEIAPIISMPRAMTVPKAFVVTKEQQQQASLLKQLSLAQPTPVIAPGQTATKTAPVLRLILVLLLAGAIISGLLGPDWLATSLPTASPAIEQLHTAVQAAAGQPVLVAFEYTPARAGELSPQAELLVQALADNGSQIVTISQAATGTALAATLTEGQNRVEMGLLPGEAVGLRQLGSCLDTTCTSIFGRNLTGEQQQALADIGLIILLTGDQDSLVNWVEQVGAVSGVPVAASITQALQPAALPYFASGQLEGMLAGLTDTAVYRQTYLDAPSEQIMDLLNAQGSAQMVAAILLLLGALIYSISATRKKDKA